VKAIHKLLKDRRRSQQGSVLSGVLIIVAFLAVIAGALMTELSTNFLLSSTLVNRVQTQATVNSAVEVALNQLQSQSVNTGCAAPIPVSVNGLTAVATIVSCKTVIDRSSPQSFSQIAISSPFQIDGVYAGPPGVPGLNDYVVGDSGGTVFDFRLGRTAPRWTSRLGGRLTAAPLVMPDPNSGGQFLDLIPMTGSACGGEGDSSCIRVLRDDGSSATPAPSCTLRLPAAATSSPAAGTNNPGFAFVGDGAGNLYALDTSSFGGCDVESRQFLGDPIVSGPVVFPCPSGCSGKRPDEVFVLTTSGGSTQLEPFTFASGSLTPDGKPLVLPWANPQGIAVENATMPSRLAISFAGGRVATVKIDGNANMTAVASLLLPAGLAAAPYWRHGTNLIGVGHPNGTLYVLNAGPIGDVPSRLVTYGTYVGDSAIRTTPAADGAGNWYFAADNGLVYEVQALGGAGTMTLAATFGSAGAMFNSSPVLKPCQNDICVYLASTDARAYLLDLDARSVVITACAGSPCINPRVWTSVEIGMPTDDRAVHVQGWSYYAG
jgi:hypothetical protein